jgi:hypothetical protein
MVIGMLAVGCDDGGGVADEVDQGDPGGMGGVGGMGGAGGMGGEAGGAGGTPDCAPDAAGYDAVADTITTYCGDCHGETPQFGAPNTLTGFDASQANLERMLARMRQGTMPPAGQPQIPADALNAIFDWATCGAEMITPNPGGFDVSREIYPDPGIQPEGTEQMDFVATDGGIAPDRVDDYRCWTFKGTEVDRFIRRFEPVIDDARVLHHMVLYQTGFGDGDGSEIGCGNSVNNIIYAWAPGQQALSFPEGGLRTGPDDRYVLEIHYNNSAGLADVADESGVRLFHGPPVGKEVGMLSLGPEGFVLPDGQQTIVGGQCTVQDSLEVIAAMPHMHEVGWGLQSTLYRAGSADPEDFITLTDWDFDAQFFYTVPLQLEPGDQIVTECTFRNMTGDLVSYGPRTEDEMCYNFVYVSPPPARGQCDGPVTIGVDPADRCIGPDTTETPTTTGPFIEGIPPAVTHGEIQKGLYVLTGAEFWVEDADISFAVVDIEQSSIDAAGMFSFLPDERVGLEIDGLLNVVTTTGQTFDQPATIAGGGPTSTVDFGTGDVVVEGDCGDLDGETLNLLYSADGPNLSVDIPVEQINSVLRLRFERVP